MEWMDYLNESVKYIEEHLTDEIDLNKVSKIAGCSSYHYQRMFSYIANIPLSEYIRRRRMTKAALDLQSSNEKIIHIALKYGYESPTAFNRAFQSVHGVAPSLARENGIQLKAFPPISFQLSIKGEIELKYKIVKMDSFKIIGVKEHYLINIEDNFQNIPLFWAKTTQTGVIPSILSRMNQEPFGLLGVSTCMNGKDFEYYIAVSSNGETPSDLVDYIVPECTWAMFECIGALPNAIQNLQRRIITEWLPSSGYEYANAPDIEVYYERNQQAEDYKCEVWVPITKKSL